MHSILLAYLLFSSENCDPFIKKNHATYSQVHKYWDIDTILTFLALYTTTMDFKWNE